jgi:hypothetical protein
MRWTVVWTPVAREELADLWTTGSDRQAVADAANEIDRLLKYRADTVGSALGQHRLLVIEPLEVLYRVLPDDRMVRVIRVARYP